ncbi:MAG: DUF721 domain-containing protein [Comamonas sp.]|nr:DUF721 domain-containing protein [Comamonas sp.]
MHTRRHHPISLEQASREAPELLHLLRQTRESEQRLQAVRPLLPVPLYAQLQAGPIEGLTWCLLVKNAAAAAKLRHLQPALVAHLRSMGWQVDSIRLRVLAQS